uniref:Uncharacterized protein n=1 Tax=Rhodnius prolixus TaxID=13249 RepID=T1HG37_RHOPR
MSESDFRLTLLVNYCCANVEEKEKGNDLPPEKGEGCTLDKVEEEKEECTSNKVEEEKEEECTSVKEEEEDEGKDEASGQTVRSSIFQNPPKLRLNDDLVADMYFGTSLSRLQSDLLDNPFMEPHPPNKFFLSRQIKK